MTTVFVRRRVIDMLYEFAMLTSVAPFRLHDYVRKQRTSDLWEVNMNEQIYAMVVKLRRPEEPFDDAAERVLQYSIDWATGQVQGATRRVT
jgi:hypothetical protein